MARVIGIDYGRKRIGIAVTDENKIIATALDTIHAKDALNYLKKYIEKENVERIVIGMPKQLNNTDSESVSFVKDFIKKLNKMFPGLPVEEIDERFTSKIAAKAIRDSGAKKKVRQDKALVDKVSAVIILQSYLEMTNGFV